MAVYESHNSGSGLILRTVRGKENMDFHAHLHTSFELLSVYKGELTVLIEDKEYRLFAGDSILVLPNLIHAYRTEKYSLIDLVIFSCELLPEIYDEARSGLLKMPIIKPKKEVTDIIYGKEVGYFALKSAIYSVADEYSKNAEVDLKAHGGGIFALKLSRYLDEHCTEEINEDSAAKFMGYHPRYLSSLIAKSFGVSFKQLLNEYRIARAASMLSGSEVSITEIYLAVGYDSQCSFNRNFKSIMGLTPREYRRGLRAPSLSHHI